MSRFVIFVMIVIFPAVLLAKPKTVAPGVYLQGKTGMHLCSYAPGDRSSGKESFSKSDIALLSKFFSTEKGKVYLCWGLSDGIQCQGKYGLAERNCQAALRRDRCDAVGEVLAPLGVTVLHAAGGKGFKVDPEHRGVLLRVFDRDSQDDQGLVPYCTGKDFEGARRIYLEESRKVLPKENVQVVPEKRTLRQVQQTRVVLITYPAYLDRSNSLVTPKNKVCKALISGKQVAKKAPAAKVTQTLPPKKVDSPKKDPTPVVTDKKPAKTEDAVEDPVVDDKSTTDATPVAPVKKPDKVKDPEPTNSMPLFLRKALIFGGFYYAKECSSLSNSEASNLAVEAIFPLVLKPEFALRVALGGRTVSWNRFEEADQRVHTTRHDFFFYAGVEAMYRFKQGETGLRIGSMANTNFGQYRPQAEAIARIFLYKESLSLDLRAGVGIFRYGTVNDPNDTEFRPYGFGLVGLTLHF